MTLIDQIREMIAEGETERSLKELYNYVKENNADVIDKLVMLRSRMQNMQNALLNGTMDDQDAAIERAKINEAILKLLPQLTPEYLAQAAPHLEPAHQITMPEKARSAPARNRKMLYIIGGVLLFIILLAILIPNIVSPQEVLPANESTDEEIGNSTAQGDGMLSYLIANQGIWESNPTESNETVLFKFESNVSCDEIINGQVINKFDVVGVDSDFITLHDPERKMNLRIGINVAQYQNEGEEAWHDLYSGAWRNASQNE